jgi:DNA (cytosine-5)-methyltransferase 1
MEIDPVVYTTTTEPKEDGYFTVVSLFTGAGGLDLGFIWGRFDIVWANDIDPDAVATYKKYFGNRIVCGDLKNYIDTLPRADVLIGGPPCQSFSLVGKRLPDDPRGELVFLYMEAVKRVVPRVFVMENVPGLLASKYNGRRLPVYLAEEFTKLGYTVKIFTLDATWFWVPQRRRRVFIVGARNVLLPDGLEAIAQNFTRRLLGLSDPLPVTVARALDDLPRPVPRGGGPVFYTSEPHSDYAGVMRRGAGRAVTCHEEQTLSERERLFLEHIPPGGNYRNIPDELCTPRILKFKQTGGRTTTYGRLHPDAPAYTVNTYFNRPNVGVNFHHREKRLITAREAMRLQSFPDWFTPEHRSQRSLCSQIGNAVPPFLALGLAGMVKTILCTQ